MNILDYLEKEFSSFERKPFNVVDSAILSQFCMVRCEGLVPPFNPDTLNTSSSQSIGSIGLIKRLGTFFKKPEQTEMPLPAQFSNLLRAERYAEMFTGLVPDRIKATLVALAASPRFRRLGLLDYLSIFDKESNNQFAALTFVHGNKDSHNEFAYIGFRGTDTSLTGWRENFNMAYTSPVPAQAQALHYLETVAGHLPKRLYVGGHSKGGNLALYAALKANPEIQSRIETVFAHDAPGFKEGAITPDEWKRLEGKINRTIPQESIVGMLMNCPVTAHVVQAQEHGFDQHSIFNWDVSLETSNFVYAGTLSDSSQFFNEVFSEWLARYSDEQAAQIVDALFKAIEVSGISNASELFFGGIKTIPLLTKAAQNLDNESGTVLRSALGSLAAIAANHAGANVSKNMQEFGRGVSENLQDASRNVQEFFSSKFSRE